MSSIGSNYKNLSATSRVSPSFTIDKKTTSGQLVSFVFLNNKITTTIDGNEINSHAISGFPPQSNRNDIVEELKNSDVFVALTDPDMYGRQSFQLTIVHKDEIDEKIQTSKGKKITFDSLNFNTFDDLRRCAHQLPSNESLQPAALSIKFLTHSKLCKELHKEFSHYQTAYEADKNKIEAGAKALPTIGQKKGRSHTEVSKAINGFIEHYSQKQIELYGEAMNLHSKLESCFKDIEPLTLKLLQQEIKTRYSCTEGYWPTTRYIKDAPTVRQIIMAYIDMHHAKKQLINVYQYLQASSSFLKNEVPGLLSKVIKLQKEVNDLQSEEREKISNEKYTKALKEQDNRHQAELQRHFDTVRQAQEKEQALVASTPKLQGSLILTKKMYVITESTYIQLRLFKHENKIQAEISSFLYGSPLNRIIQEDEITWKSGKSEEGILNPDNWIVQGDQVIYQERSGNGLK